MTNRSHKFLAKLGRGRRAPPLFRRFALPLASAIVASVCANVSGAATADHVDPTVRTTNSEDDAAAEAEYVTAIRGARCLMLEGSYASAREALVEIPKNQRNWEWAHLLEECAAPPWKVELPLGKDERLHGSAEISATLMPLVRKIVEEVASDDSNKGGIVMSPDRNFAAVYTGAVGRHGAHLCVLKASQQTPTLSLGEEDLKTLDPGELARSYDSRVLFSMYTGAYGGSFSGVRFAPDGSCLVFVAPADSCFVPSSAHDVGQDTTQTEKRQTSSDENEVRPNADGLALFFVPLPAAPEAQVGSDAQENGITVTRTPWQKQRFEELPDDIRNAVAQIENFDSSTGTLSARFADYHIDSDGKVLGLFNCFNSPAAAEVRELPSGKILANLGKRCDFNVEGQQENTTDIYSLLSDIDIGGAFSPDGRQAIVSPCAKEEALAQKNESANFGSVVAFNLADGTATLLQLPRSTDDHAGRTLCPVWGWSPDSRYAFSSIFDGAEIRNNLGICDAATGQKVEAVPENLRYVAWNPDASRLYMIKHNSGSLLVADSSTFETVAEVPDATKPSGYPAFLDLPVSSNTNGTRFTMGRLLFDPDQSEKPMVRLSSPPEIRPLDSWLLDAKQRKSNALNIAQETLLYWVTKANKQ